MGSHRVINMGVPVLVGVCQQAGSGPAPPPNQFSITQIGTQTVTFGNSNATGGTIDRGIARTGTANSANSFTIGVGEVVQLFDERIPERVNHAWVVTIDTSLLDRESLPADGSCSVSVSFELDSGGGFEVWNYATGDSLGTSVNFVANNLNRLQITGEEGIAFFGAQTLLWTPTNEGYLRFSVGEAPVISVRVSILQSDGEFLSQTQSLTLTEESCDLFLIR